MFFECQMFRNMNAMQNFDYTEFEFSVGFLFFHKLVGLVVYINISTITNRERHENYG